MALTRHLQRIGASTVLVLAIAAATVAAQQRHAPAGSSPRATAQPRSQSAPRQSAERSSPPQPQASQPSRSAPPPPAATSAPQQGERHRPEGTPQTGQAGERDRGGSPAIGRGVPRQFRPRPGPFPNQRFRYYSPYWYGGGLGYYYDPYWWGGYSTYGYYPYGYGGGYGAGYGYGYPSYSSGYDEGGIKLKVRPRDAQVYVDGYFAGIVDSFDGTFQKLSLPPGPHRIEIRAPGYETLIVDTRIYSDETITYRGELRPTRP